MPYQSTHDTAIRCPGTRANSKPCRAPLIFPGAGIRYALRLVARNAQPSAPDRSTHTCNRCHHTVEFWPILVAAEAPSARTG